MKNNPECFAHCPRILDAAELAARLGTSGVVQSEATVKEPINDLIGACEAVAGSDCEGPIRRDVAPKVTLLGRLGLTHTDGTGVEYTCATTGQGRQEKRYHFEDTV